MEARKSGGRESVAGYGSTVENVFEEVRKKIVSASENEGRRMGQKIAADGEGTCELIGMPRNERLEPKSKKKRKNDVF